MQGLSIKSIEHPRGVMWGVAALCVITLVLVVLPLIAPKSFSFLSPVTIDTDPENMLSPDEPVRIFHNKMKKEFALYDMIVVGVVNQSDPNGVFNVSSLENIYQLAESAKKIRWQNANGETEGVIDVELMAPSTVDNIAQAGIGTVRFEWLMAEPPGDQQGALAIQQKLQRLPMFKGTLLSDSGKALALYVPITSKNVSYQVADQLEQTIETFKGDEDYYVTGLPVAQDTFGVEMFIQMAISAPMAMLLIFLLMLFFFRKVSLIISPLIVAMASVVMAMGLLIIAGNTIHIMSSMIPIFIMPIAVLDSVHILSEFFDRYPLIKDKRKTLDEVMEELSAPMLYTSLTTCAGFGSLALTPIPPVQVFGIYISLGVFFAWIFTITMIPAYIMLMPDKSLEGFGHKHDPEESTGLMGSLLAGMGHITFNHAKAVLGVVAILCVVAYYGINKIQINDNPVKWFTESHKIRIADDVLNKEFAGTYMAYLALEAEDQAGSEEFAKKLKERLKQSQNPALSTLITAVDEKKGTTEIIERLKKFTENKLEQASDSEWENWDNALQFIDSLDVERQYFKQPRVLEYIDQLQQHLIQTGLVGKVNSLADVVKTVHRELLLGDQKEYRIPDSVNAVGQTLVSYQNSHRPNDLWHFVTPDYTKTNLWIQLKSGDNRDMSAVVDAIEKYFDDNPGPISLKHNWFGLTYINVVWQQKMVKGMLEAFLGSFVIVLILMIILFRSIIWGALAMIPLTVTIGLIYGVIGLVGKDYDMPVAVLSSLSLGLAVDYAIHFLARSRHLRTKHTNWEETSEAVFGEPARAIVRNVIVIGVGFMPLLAAPLIPYKTVGALISAILLFAGLATLVILPALLRLLEPYVFRTNKS